MKKIAIVTILTLAMLMMFSGIAQANFAIHGGYATDTDACAGCHRAHSSSSTATRDLVGGDTASALLVSDAETIQEFCYACHGDLAPGASTNVVMGIFDGGPSAPDSVWALNDPNLSIYDDEYGLLADVLTLYETNSSLDATLNGGGFDFMPSYSGSLVGSLALDFTAVSSEHDMDLGTGTDPIWGFGNSADVLTNLTCTGCHDPHGSSNYRLLKDQLPSSTTGVMNVVGGYAVDGSPTPFVISYEEGYPTDGWERGADSMVPAYKPNYTEAEYAYMPEDALIGERSISGWCAGCHETYIVVDDTFGGLGIVATQTYNYPALPADPATHTLGEFSFTNDDDEVGARSRHRHPINLPLEAGIGAGKTLAVDVVLNDMLPLEINLAQDGARDPGVTTVEWTENDFFGCLTCHRAHGTMAAMSDWAESAYVYTAGADVEWYPVLTPGSGGVNPNFSSSLLRTDNRGVCERCHNK